MLAHGREKQNHWWRQQLPSVKETSVEASMTSSQVIVIAGSMGAIPVIQQLLKGLPVTYPFPILICQHRGRSLPNLLPTVLGTGTKLRVKLAEVGEMIGKGTVYVAPAHAHLIINEKGCLELIDGRKLKFLTSAAEPLFASAAAVYGPRVVAIVLTGFGNDAALGVQEVKECGGTVIVQDEATCEAFDMPKAVIKTGGVDQVLSVSGIQEALLKLTEDQTSHAG